MLIRRGDIFYADLRPVVGSEQGGVRPVLIIQNDVGNRHSPTVICAAITSQMNKAKLPTHVELDCTKYALVKDSVVLLEQLRTIDSKNGIHYYIICVVLRNGFQYRTSIGRKDLQLLFALVCLLLPVTDQHRMHLCSVQK